MAIISQLQDLGLKIVGGSDVAPANRNVRSKHTVAGSKNVVSLMISLKL